MKGSCLCGAIAYEVDGFSSDIQHCACRTCQKSHSAAFNTAACVKHDQFRWLRGEASLKGYESSQGKIRYFCRECGSQMIAQREGKDYLMLRVATLDEDPMMKPTSILWMSDASPWLSFEHGIASYQEELVS